VGIRFERQVTLKSVARVVSVTFCCLRGRLRDARLWAERWKEDTVQRQASLEPHLLGRDRRRRRGLAMVTLAFAGCGLVLSSVTLQ